MSATSDTPSGDNTRLFTLHKAYEILYNPSTHIGILRHALRSLLKGNTMPWDNLVSSVADQVASPRLWRLRSVSARMRVILGTDGTIPAYFWSSSIAFVSAALVLAGDGNKPPAAVAMDLYAIFDRTALLRTALYCSGVWPGTVALDRHSPSYVLIVEALSMACPPVEPRNPLFISRPILVPVFDCLLGSPFGDANLQKAVVKMAMPVTPFDSPPADRVGIVTLYHKDWNLSLPSFFRHRIDMVPLPPYDAYVSACAGVENNTCTFANVYLPDRFPSAGETVNHMFRAMAQDDTVMGQIRAFLKADGGTSG